MPALSVNVTHNPWRLQRCLAFEAARFCVRRVLLLVLLLTSVACAGKEAVLHPPTAGDAGQAWDNFTASRPLTGPFRVSATLRYETPSDENTRVSALMWGNGSLQNPHPLRLDLQASLGITVAKVREDAASFVAYSPDEKTAYGSEGPNRALTSFGMPIPVSLGELSRLLNGQAVTLFAPPTTSAGTPPRTFALTNRGITFPVPDANLPGIIELSANGTLLSWRGTGGNGWVMEFVMAQDNPLVPDRLTISHPAGYKATITVKKLERLAAPFKKDQLALTLPDGTTHKPLGE